MRAVGVQRLIPEAVLGAQGPGARGARLDGLQGGDRLVAAPDGDLVPAVGGSLPTNGLNVVSRCYPAVSLGARHQVRKFHEYTVGVSVPSAPRLPRIGPQCRTSSC